MSTWAEPRWRAEEPQSLIVSVGAVFLAIVVGVALAVKVAIGVALVFAFFFALLLVFAPAWALIAFVPLIFLESVYALNLAGKAAGLLVALSWIAAAATRRIDISEFARRRRRLFEAILLLLGWLCLSAIWATSASATVGDLWHWFAVSLLFVVVATSVADERVLLWFCIAFVAGAVLGVLIGLATGMVEGGAGGDPRLEGGAGDPNFLAAGLVPAIVLAAGILVAVKHPVARLGCAFAIFVCSYGVAATQSHGGAVALVAAAFVALFVFKRRRIYVALACLGIVTVGAVYFASTPTAWNRITHVENGGSGREDLWTVAWRVAEEHPVLGVGLSNYEIVAKDYTRRPGSLKNVNKIAEKPHVVHNTYLEALTETGVVGLALLLFIAGASIYSAWLAGKRFEAMENDAMEALSRAIVVGAIGLMVAAFFVSAGVDKRLWLLFALGPASLAIAERARRGPGYQSAP